MRTDLKAGLLVISAFLLLAYMVSRLTQGAIAFGEAGTEYRMVTDDATGLVERSKVRVAGIEVGELTDITLEGNRAHLTIEIRPDLPLYSDGSAQLRTIGYLGDRYISLSPGTPSAERLEEGDYIPLSAAVGDIGSLTEQGLQVMENLNTFLQEMNLSLFGVAPSRQEPPPVPRQAPSPQDDADERQETSGLNARGTGRAPAQTSSDPRTLEERQKEALERQNRLDRMVRNLERFSRELAKVRNLDELSSHLERIAANLEAITGQIRTGEGTVGRLVYDQEQSDRITATLSGASRVMAQIEGTNVFLDAKSAWLAQTDQSLSVFGAKLRTPSGNRFMIGATHRSSPFRETDANLAFNAQFTRSFGGFAGRVGLFESTGGLGGEYWWNPRERVYFELYRFGAGSPPQVNLGADILLFGPLGAWVGGDHLASDEFRSFFVGLRVNWTLVELEFGRT